MGILVKYLLPLAAVAMLAFAVVHVVRTSADKPLAEPPFPPPQAGEESALAAAGTVEAKSENVAVAPALPGVVAFVLVRAGQKVKAHDPLFRLEDTALRPILAVRQAQLATARARLARLERKPRPDELLAAAARVRAARADLAGKRAAYEHAQNLRAKALIGELDLEQRKQAVAAAAAVVEQAEAEDRLLRAGAAEADRAVARAGVAEALSLVAQAQSDLDRLTTRSPLAGTVLQLNVRPGEAVGARPDLPPVVVGDTTVLHVRVEIDEQLLGRFRPGAPARAFPRGEGGPALRLTFVRTEPMLVPRRILSGAPGERTDTRVLQAIYRLEPGQEKVYVGQQLDVFITAEPRP
jgi:multidrug efflux pump subunit AcrA (membrane-fusion protein)